MPRRFVLAAIVPLLISAPWGPPERNELWHEIGRHPFCLELLAEHPFPPKVARWCALVHQHFGDRWTHWALHTISCESAGDPSAKNPRSSASGLFQQLGRYWPRRSERAGWEGASIFDPEANVAVSARLFSEGRGASHWSCKAGHALR